MYQLVCIDVMCMLLTVVSMYLVFIYIYIYIYINKRLVINSLSLLLVSRFYVLFRAHPSECRGSPGPPRAPD